MHWCPLPPCRRLYLNFAGNVELRSRDRSGRRPSCPWCRSEVSDEFQFRLVFEWLFSGDGPITRICCSIVQHPMTRSSSSDSVRGKLRMWIIYSDVFCRALLSCGLRVLVLGKRYGVRFTCEYIRWIAISPCCARHCCSRSFGRSSSVSLDRWDHRWVPGL